MTVRSKILALAFLGLLFVLLPSTLSANGTPVCAVSGNLVLNCGFELGTKTTTVGGYTNPGVPVDWTSNAGFNSEPSYNFVTTNAYSGNYALSIGNYDYQPLATLSQTIADVSGGSYTGSFYAYDGGYLGDGDAFLMLTLNGTTTLVDLSDTAGPGYAEYTFSFIGTGSDILTFGATTNPAEWYIDDVTVLGPSPSPTPEPISMLLFGTGLLSVGFAARKKRNCLANS
jgi:hypothetical protein